MYWIRTDKEYRPKRLKIWGLGLFLALQINALSHNFHHNSSGACKYNLSCTNYLPLIHILRVLGIMLIPRSVLHIFRIANEVRKILYMTWIFHPNLLVRMTLWVTDC